jgi:hypothetical protein
MSIIKNIRNAYKQKHKKMNGVLEKAIHYSMEVGNKTSVYYKNRSVIMLDTKKWIAYNPQL